MLRDFALQLLADLGFAADKQNADAVMTAGENCPFHLGLGGPVGPHRIDCDYGWHSRKGNFNLAGLLGVEDLAAFVVSAFGTDAVRHLLFVAVRTFRQRVRSEKVVGATASGSSFGVPSFWIRHGLILS